MRLLGSVAIAVALLAVGCGSGKSPSPSEPEDSGVAGPDASGDLPDAGAQPDAAYPPIPLPQLEGWTFYGPQHGGPKKVYGVTADRGGNLWVAGGEDGLFLLKPGATSFRRFTLADGLTPYGTSYQGQGPVTEPYLKVISVSGGPAGTVFVGYEGKPPGPGEYGCEDNWDGPSPNPNIYKSGDADRVTLTADDRIQVVHYDLSTPPGRLQAEMRGREKLCDVYRILYDANSASVWFGANHAYAWGDPSSSKVLEHIHPILNGYVREDSPHSAVLSNYYFGLAVEGTGDLWVGGLFRSQHCLAGKRAEGFYDCEAQGSIGAGNIDWWPDPVQEYARPSGRVDDAVSGMSLAADGSLWIGSMTNGLAHRAADGSVSYVRAGMADPSGSVFSVQVDPSDGSVWAGGGCCGLTRIRGGQTERLTSFGMCAGERIPDIQIDPSSGGRRLLVAFFAGCVGVYDGK